MRRDCITYLLFGQLLTLLLSGCAVSVAADGIATQTKRVLSITGLIDDGFYVRFAVGYGPLKDTKGSCTKFEPLAGLWVPRDQMLYYDVVSSNGEYTVQLPLSAIPPGECEWRPYMISYANSETHKFSTYLSLIAIDNPNGQRATSITYWCPKPVVFCSGNAASLRRSVTKDQASLEVNFLAAPSAH